MRFYDDNGQFVRAALQQGQGPAELPALDELHHCQPGVLAAIGRGRLAVIDERGDVRANYLFVDNTGRRLYPPLACNRDGRLLAMDRGQTVSVEPVTTSVPERSIVHILLLDIDGTIVRDFGEFPGDEDDFESLLDEEPSDSQQGRAVERLRMGLRQFGGESAVRASLPETLPAYSRFVVDATDHLWVEHYRYLARDPHLWSIFAPDGRWLGEVEVPGTFDVTDIGRDYVLGVYRGELDEQSVRLYRLIRN